MTIIASAMLLAILAWNLPRHFDREFIVGVVTGGVLIAGLIRLKPSWWDTALGKTSYGCFLYHVTLFALMKAAFEVEEFTPELRVLSILVSVSAGFASYYWIERPTIARRRRIGTPVRAPNQTSP